MNLRGKLWCKLSGLKDSEDSEQIFEELATKVNVDLDEDIRHDECHKRYEVLKDHLTGEMVKPDPQKLVKILRAYVNSDPQVKVNAQGFIYIISGLL